MFTTDSEGNLSEVDSVVLPSGHLAINLLGYFSNQQVRSAKEALAATREHVAATSSAEAQEMLEDDSYRADQDEFPELE